MKNILLTIVLLAIPCFLNAQGRHMVSDSVYAYWNTNYPTYGDGGPATAAALAAAQYFATNSSGDIFIGDVGDFRIRKISHTTGIINTIAGYGVAGYSGDGGPGGSARINGIGHMCTDRAGNLYFADDSRIRKVNASTGIITTICGNGTSSFSGDGGPATAATVISASFLCMDHADNLYFVDYSRVRKIDAGTGIITTLAGNGSVADSGDGGPATAAALCYCNGLCVDWNRNIYFANGFSCQSRIRKIDTFGIITNYAGGGATIINGGPATATYLSVESLGTDSLGNLYVQTDGDIRKINYNTGIINKVYSGYYFDKGILVKDNGDIFLNTDPWVQLLKGARSGIDTWTVFDSASHCGLPGSLAFGLNGISTDTPSVTDSILITIDAADDYYPRYRYKHLPYNYTSGAYQFGNPYCSLDTYTYRLPGIYHPGVYINSLGFEDYYPLPADTVGYNCDTTITGITWLAVSDSLISGPCVFPGVVRFRISGTISGYPTGTDSIYLVLAHTDSAWEIRKLPYTYTGSDYTFSYTCNHIYTVAGTFAPDVFAITANGWYTARASTDGNIITNCTGASGYVYHSESVYGDPCRVPDTVTYFGDGQLFDSAMTSSMVHNHVFFGDGTDTSFVLPVVHNGHGEYTYRWGGSITHAFTTPGIYTTAFSDTAGIYGRTNLSDPIVVGLGCSPVSGSFYIDANSNCIKDSGETGLAYWPYALRLDTTGEITYGWCDDTGGYALNIINGYRYTIIADPFGSTSGASGASIAVSCPASGTDTVTATSSGSVTRDFGFNCIAPTVMDMSVSGWGWGFIPGDTGTIGVWSSNAYGFMCDTLSADITLVLDTNLSYAGMRTGPSPVRISGDTLVWHFTTAASLFDFSGYIKVVVDTTATIFDTLQNRLYVTPTRITDPDTTNNYYTWREQIRSSYDPNEKQVSPAGYGPQGYIPNGTPLSYIIHFQNTGTAPARNITVSDTISEHLDFSTLQVVSSSFPVLVYQVAGNVVKFKFNGINLPDSTSDPVGSIGYIAYNIVPYDSLAPGTQIRNTAGIYFDYNPAVYTNGTLNTIEDSIGTITGLDSVCAGGTMVLHNRVAGGRWAASNGRATVNDTGLVTGITSGRDTITYTLYGHQTASKVIFVNTPPVTVSISGRDSVCTGASLLLTASTPGGTWLSTGTGIVSVSAVGRLAGLSPGTDTVWYTVANTCGIAADSLPVFVRTVPGTPSLSGPSTVCEGASITLSSSIAGGTWRAAGSHLSVTGGVVAASSAGTDTVEYTVTNMCGAASVQATINILPLPVAATITGPASFCNGTVAAYSASSTGGTWTHSTPSVASLSGGSLYGLAPGSDTLFYALSNTCGTTTTYTVTTVTTVPATPAVLAPPAVCVGGTVALSSVPTGGVWRASSLSSGLVALSGSTASGVRAGSDSLFYTVANSCGTTSAHLIITIDTPLTAATITGADTVCAGSYTLFSASAAGGTWSVASTATASVSSTGNVLGIMPGSDSVYYALTNTCGNYSNGRPITVMAAPDAAVISGPSSVCMGATISLSPSALGGVWSRSNFSASVAAGNVTGVAAGTDTMYYTLTNRCGGTRSAAVVTVHAAPYAGSISGFSTLCTGVTDTLVSTVTGGRWVSTAPGLASVDSGAVTATAAGSVTLYYIVGNACGADTAAATVTLYAAPVAGTITGADSVCAGSTLLLAATEAGGTWNAHSSVLSVRGGTVTGINAGIDTVFYSVTNMCGTASAAHPVRVLALPLAGSLSGPSGLCRGAAITLSPTASGGVWTNADTAISTVVGGTVTGLAAGRDTIFYSVTNSCGTAVARAPLTIFPLPDAGDITGDTVLCTGSTAHVTVTGTGGNWATSTGSVATVSSAGAVYGIRGGSATIYYLVSNSCGADTARWAVAVVPVPVAGTITGADTLCLGDSATLSATTAGGSWGSTNTLVVAVSAAGRVFAMGTGLADVVYTVANMCDTVTATHHVYVQPAGLCLLETGGPSITEMQVALYPNPSGGRVVLEAKQTTLVQFVVTDMAGRTVLETTPAPGTQRLDVNLSHLSAGMYLYRITTSNGLRTGKLVLE